MTKQGNQPQHLSLIYEIWREVQLAEDREMPVFSTPQIEFPVLPATQDRSDEE